MSAKMTISISAPSSDAKQILDFIMSHPNFGGFDLRVSSAAGVVSQTAASAEDSNSSPSSTGAPNSLKHFVRDADRRILKFVLDHDGQFHNADLAKELGVDTPLTCFPLGRITRKLQKAGLRIDGAQGENWYTKLKTNRGTLLSVRMDVLAMFREALRD